MEYIMSLFEDNEKLKLAKAVLNHTKTVANDYIEKHSKPAPNINEDEIYEIVMLEIEKNNKVKSTWARALAQSEGDNKKAQSLYINMRVSELVQEEKEKIISYKEFERARQITQVEANKKRLLAEKENNIVDQEAKKCFEEEGKPSSDLEETHGKELIVVIIILMIIFIIPLVL